jgi:ubiquitin-protein ligase
MIANFKLQELGELLKTPPPGVTVALADESNLHKWDVWMEGPEKSPYSVTASSLSSLI